MRRYGLFLLTIAALAGWGMSIAGWATALAARRQRGGAPVSPTALPRPVKVTGQIALPAVVAEVDGHKIAADEFLGRLLRCYGREVLERLIRNALIERLAKREGVSVSEGEAEAELRKKMEEAARSGLTWNKWLEAQNLSEEDLRRDLKYELLLKKVAERHTEVTEQEIRHYYETYRYDLGGPEEVRVSHILVDKRSEAERLLERAKKGEKFSILARKYSHDLSTKDRGGDLGWIKRGVLAPELRPLEDMAFSLKPGQLGIVKTIYGWHVVMVMARKRKRIPSFEEARERVRREVFEYKRELMGSYLLDMERKRAEVKIFVNF